MLSVLPGHVEIAHLIGALRAYELADGEWKCVNHGVLEAAGGAGRVALTFGKMTEGVRMACKDASGVYSSEVTMAAGDDAAVERFPCVHIAPNLDELKRWLKV